MNISSILFYLISALVLIFGALSVSSKRFFRSAIYLLLCLLLTSGLYFLLSFNFIAIVQIMVYVGGIVVLILFSILLTHTPESSESSGNEYGFLTYSFQRKIGAFLLSAAAFIYTAYLLLGHHFNAAAGRPDMQMAVIGRQLLSTGKDGYILPFELVSVLLLAAMLGSIVIAYKPKNEEMIN